MGANDRVGVGVVGCGDRMKDALIPAFDQNAQDMNFEFVAVRISGAGGVTKAQPISKRREPQIPSFPVRNNDELYARKDVDAVLVATADFQHALHGVEAVKAGRDAYVEKPTAHTMADARAFRDAVRQTGKIVQVGTQRSQHPELSAAAEYIQSGKFGDIVMVEMTWNVNQPGRWRRPDVVPLLKEEDTDWKRYLLNRPYEPFDARKSPSSGSSGPIPPAFPTNGWFTRSTRSTGLAGIPIPAALSPMAASMPGGTAAKTGTP